MSTVTIYASANGGDLQMEGSTYAMARDGAGTIVEHTNNAYARVGQIYAPAIPLYLCYELFLEFDLSPLSGTVTAAPLEIASNNNDASDTNFIIRARDYAYGTSLEAADKIAGASLASTGTLRAHYDTASGWAANDSYNLFTDDAMVALAQANIGGLMRLVLYSSRQESGTTPTGDEYNYVGGPSYTYPPRITFTYTPGGGGGGAASAFIGGGFL